MSIHKSKNGNSVKWLNYPTNVKDIYFRIQCNKSSASIFIDIQHRDEEIRKLFYEQFLELKILFKIKLEITRHGKIPVISNFIFKKYF